MLDTRHIASTPKTFCSCSQISGSFGGLSGDKVQSFVVFGYRGWHYETVRTRISQQCPEHYRSFIIFNNIKPNGNKERLLIM
jgi:hypothetical protein